MPTATKKSGVVGRIPRRAPEGRVPKSMQFLIFEDNGGNYHWMIVSSDGAVLVRSDGFASYQDAEQAAHDVRNGAASALFTRRADRTHPVDLIARSDVSDDDSDAERWLDEGGSFSSAPVAR